ncbi:uncharacterized protein LOC115640703 [Gopherus evgoodei]|uniref:uncharacterized protein LOC115640703 n=1 Tax=Gopherus evgoodei TaxID=1825980 RepID=UPI0011CFF98B|nr:uncharacterized protein LOC115640703 [Gopherus evgoodei]
MVGVFLFWVFVGRCSPLSLAVPAVPVAVVPGGTALLPTALRLPAPPPPFFQVRWRFLPTGRLVLLLAAQDCGEAAPWRRSCRLALEHGRGYEGRAGLGPRDAALLLRDARPEDAGTYRVSVLGLDVTASAEVNLTLAPAPTPAADTSLPTDPTTVLPPTAPAPANSTELQGLWLPASPPGALHLGSLLRPPLRDMEPPLAPVWATLDGGGAVVSNAVRLGLAGLVLCLLALIVGEYVLSTRNKDTLGTGSPPDAAATITTLSTIYVLQEMPISDASEELYASLSF